jgi:hypothetical protein
LSYRQSVFLIVLIGFQINSEKMRVQEKPFSTSLTMGRSILPPLLLFLSQQLSFCLAASQKNSFPFKYLPYEPLMKEFQNLNDQYPDYVDFTSVQEKYKIPHMGDCGSKKCEVYFARITHEASLLPQKDARPEIFLSGALHGNERIGPTTVFETARLLVSMASCVDKASVESIADGSLCENVLDPKDEAMLLGGLDGYMNTESSSVSQDTTTIAHKIKAVRRKRLLWIHRLVHTRSIYIMPTANAYGYYQNKREEGRIDPNRDFPFVQNKERCFQTVAARSMNELFREHMFQISVTVRYYVIIYASAPPHLFFCHFFFCACVFSFFLAECAFSLLF